MSIIHLVTHGEKFPGADTGLTPLGQEQVRALKPYIPAVFSEVLCGVGPRHRQTAEILGLEPDRYDQCFGVCESKNREKNTLVFPDGKEIPYPYYTGAITLKKAFLEAVSEVKGGSIIITSRPRILALGWLKPKSAAIYAYDTVTTRINQLYCAAPNQDE